MSRLYLLLFIAFFIPAGLSLAGDSTLVKKKERKLILNLNYYRVLNRATVIVEDEYRDYFLERRITDIEAFVDSAKVLTLTSNLNLSASYLFHKNFCIKLGITTGRLGVVGFRQTILRNYNNKNVTISHGFPVKIVGLNPEVSYYSLINKKIDLLFSFGFLLVIFDFTEFTSLEPSFIGSSKSKFSYHQNRIVYGFQTSPNYNRNTSIMTSGGPRLSSITLGGEFHYNFYKSFFLSLSTNIGMGLFKSSPYSFMDGHAEMRLYFARLGIGLGYCF